MADVKTVPGKGYGSLWVDSIVWGATAWDPTIGPVLVYFGERADYCAARQAHGPSDALASAGSAVAWTDYEVGTFAYALSLYSSVSNLTFALAESVKDANIVWWKTADLGGDLLGMQETPSATQRWGYFNPDGDTWGFQEFGGDGLHTVVHELGHRHGCKRADNGQWRRGLAPDKGSA
jgi:serralysin